MTEKLYETNSYIKEFTAKVISCNETDGRFAVELDKTAFFPEGGGQYADTGKLSEATVSDVQIIDGQILHFTNVPLKINSEINGVIDWPERFRRMQNHTGEHIFSGIINKLFGLDNIGFHLGDEDVTMDYSGELSYEQIAKAEAMANMAIYENIPVLCEIPNKDGLAKLTYRSKLELTDNVRIVTIPGYDVCACCAPHVKYTGEIGIIKIIDSFRQNKHTRLKMVCGSDALEYFNVILNNISEISRLLSSKHYNAFEATEILNNNYSDCKHELNQTRKKLALATASAAQESNENILLFEDYADTDTLRLIANKLLAKTKKICIALSGNDKEGYNFIAASNTVDLKIIATELRNTFDTKGGGSSTMIQGHINSTREKIELFFS